MKRLGKYMLVGLSGVMVNYAILWSFTDILGIFYMFSAIIATGIAILTNFTFNEVWTFRDRLKNKSGRHKRIFKFFAVSLSGMVIALIVLFVFVEFLNIYYLISNMIGVFFGFMWNYSINSMWTWKVSE